MRLSLTWNKWMNENMKMTWSGRGLKSEVFGGIKLEKWDNTEKTLKMPILHTTIYPLETPRLELGIPMETDERLDIALFYLTTSCTTKIRDRRLPWTGKIDFKWIWWSNDTRGQLWPKIPEICLVVEENLRKNLNQEINPTRDRTQDCWVRGNDVTPTSQRWSTRD